MDFYFLIAERYTSISFLKEKVMIAAIQFNNREADTMQGNGPKSVALSPREGSLESPTELLKCCGVQLGRQRG